jgi:hypothetical protein
MGGADEATTTARLNRLAIGSVVASAVTLSGIGSIVGIALGVVAWNQSKVRDEVGRGLALAGIALGAVTLLVSMIVVVKWIGAG